MAVPMHLDAYLRTAEDNLTVRIHKAFNKLGAEGSTRAFCFNIYFKEQYDAGKKPKKLNIKGPVVCTNPVISAVDGVVEDIEAMLIKEGGDDPIGFVRVQGYSESASREMLVNFSRHLIPIEMQTGDPNQAILQYELNALRARNRHLEEQATLSLTAILDSHKAVTKALMNSATTRTVSSASSDISSVAAVVALAVLIFAKPAILRFFGMRGDATGEQIAVKLRHWMSADEIGRAPMGEDGGAGVQVPEAAVEVEDPPRLVDWGAMLLLGEDELLRQLEEQPEVMRGLLKLAGSRPELMKKAAEYAAAASAK